MVKGEEDDELADGEPRKRRNIRRAEPNKPNGMRKTRSQSGLTSAKERRSSVLVVVI